MNSSGRLESGSCKVQESKWNKDGVEYKRYTITIPKTLIKELDIKKEDILDFSLEHDCYGKYLKLMRRENEEVNEVHWRC